MPRQITCPSCSATGQLPDVTPGEAVGCPVCKTVFLPAAENAPAAVADGPAGWGVALDAPAPHVAAAPQVAPRREVSAPVVPAGASPEGEWLRAETERFVAYVKQELDRLAQARQETAAAASRAEAARLTRAMDIGRQTAVLDARRQQLDERDEELGRRADEQIRMAGDVARREAALQGREEAIAAREARRARLERESNDLSLLVADLRVAVERLTKRRDELEAEQAAIEAKQASLDRRLMDVGRTEVAIQRRAAELDELEDTLRAEFETRERDLKRMQTVLKEEAAALRTRHAVGDPTPMPTVWRE